MGDRGRVRIAIPEGPAVVALPDLPALRYCRWANPYARREDWPRSMPAAARCVARGLDGRLAYYDFAVGRIRAALDAEAAARGVVLQAWDLAPVDLGAPCGALSLVFHDPGIFGWRATLRLVDFRPVFAADHLIAEGPS